MSDDKIIDPETGEVFNKEKKEYSVSELNNLADGILALNREKEAVEAKVSEAVQKVRDKYKDELEMIAEFDKNIKAMRVELLTALQESKLKSWKTESTTAFRTIKKKVSVVDETAVFSSLKKMKIYDEYAEKKEIFKPSFTTLLKNDEAVQKIKGLEVGFTDSLTVKEAGKGEFEDAVKKQ